VPPGAGQTRAAGPKMARSPSIHVYTHRPHCLHFYRMRELDLNYFVFAPYTHPRCCPMRGKSVPRAQKCPARPQTACTCIARIFSIAAVDLTSFVLVLGIMDVQPCTSVYIHDRMFCFRHLRAQIWYAHPHTKFTCIAIALSIAAVIVNWVCILFFSLDLWAQGPRWVPAKAGRGPKNGLLVLKTRVHASPAFSPSQPYVRVRFDSLCFGAGNHGCTAVYSRVHPLRNLLLQRLSIPLRPPQTPRQPPHRRHTAASPPPHRRHTAASPPPHRRITAPSPPHHRPITAYTHRASLTF
jgi:hypothetical protein